MPTISRKQSGAFIEEFDVPPTKSGPLDGCTFVVKDLIDIAGHMTGCGNPTWRATHPAAAVSAVCVEQLLAAGATCVGKTLTDELAFSLLGENFHYGTPLNPAAPDRVPGGSSNGSASAVACGLADFGLGTDTGGSVRVPAGNCGIFGWRPSHNIVSLAGVMPFSPTFDTVGVFTRDAELMSRVAAVLLGDTGPRSPLPKVRTIHLVREAFETSDAEVRDALAKPIERLRGLKDFTICESPLTELCGDPRAGDMRAWLTIYRVLQGSEFQSSLGAWIADAKPAFGPALTAGLEFVRKIDRTRIGESVGLREIFYRGLNATLTAGDLLCIPTAPKIAPYKGSKAYDRTSDYYANTLSITTISGVARLPQVTLPVAHVGAVPVGLSLLAQHGRDMELLATAAVLQQLHEFPPRLQ